MSDPKTEHSIVLPVYAQGQYFKDSARHKQDAAFKAEAFLGLFREISVKSAFSISSLADVGCGSGDIVKMIADGLRSQGIHLSSVVGYDVSPHVAALRNEGIEYVYGDFTAATRHVDLVTLFDVFEHVPDPVSFLKTIAARSIYVAMHIPLDDSLNCGLRNLFKTKLRNPGHLIFLDCSSALNLVAFAGLTVLDYKYTFPYETHTSLLGRIANPLRRILGKVSPWLLSKTLGGVSLMVIAQSPKNSN
jgi:SAM-dependent methyltransferase